MNTKNLLRDESLWKRIQNYSIDDPNAAFPFSKKLAKEENWSEGFTQKAIEEYKKFVYLCCISPTGGSPCQIVDKVWHMHLLYTKEYWENFCPNILKTKLHHHPSKGGNSENSLHRNWFQETLEMYEEIFQQESPTEIWKNKPERKPKEKTWRDNLKENYKSLLETLSYFLNKKTPTIKL